ncbi:uncharacterized protein LOC115454316 [Manduca sexta]|uniref:uncharacterized protein LOC115454316 n=1 Tax=Manduca sexta TaxID=7130 RepID=UPI001182E13F|nr:uncharacterized protein LOC115454316 [Manduca sexta]KAG6438686.1 hypothetical protein O3G_MSEX000147 [Manduca sexta]
MFAKISVTLALLYLASFAESNDIRLGLVTPQSRKIFSEIKEADPALWKRTDDVIVNAPNNEFISAVYVTDLRDDKDGEAYIEAGGIGTKSVTVALKSPTILRGYKFLIEVYGNDPNANYFSKGIHSQHHYDDSQYARKY